MRAEHCRLVDDEDGLGGIYVNIIDYLKTVKGPGRVIEIGAICNAGMVCRYGQHPAIILFT
jgi:hypothetical protein